MRDINRMKLFLEKLEEQWKEFPDWRFGQLMYNFMSTMGDPFYWEEEVFLEKLEIFIDNLKK
ncbi:MAG: hypothetical protein KQ78_01959 [Candidatus Izimaplasma bacterium HR2]|nr:MAG: hypothetical protein KQ78_01959 [Candidatus Izimaplasma bacterium HR2]